MKVNSRTGSKLVSCIHATVRGVNSIICKEFTIFISLKTFSGKIPFISSRNMKYC